MGLLDALGSDDAKLGIALLSASGYSPTPMSFGQRLGGALGQFNAEKTAGQDRALKQKLLQSQIDENASQNLLRQAQLARQTRQDAYYMGGGMGGGGGGVASMTAPGGAPASPTSAGVVPGSALGATAGSPVPSQGKFAEWSRQYGIPYDAFVSDYFSTGGKGIADMLMKRGTPDMQVSNGYAYDKNKVGAGYLPQLNMSQDGKASMVQIGPDGLPVVSAPRGALPTFQAYQNASNRSSADYQPETVVDTTPGPTFGQKVVKPRSQVLQPSAPPNQMPDYRPALQGLPPAQAGMTSSFQGPPEQVLPLIAGMKDPQERANAYDAYSRQMTGGGATTAPQGAGNVVELAPAAQNKVAADKEYQTKVAGDQSDQRKAIMNSGFSASGKIAKLQQIDKLLGDFEGGKLSQTALDFSSAANSLGIKLDKNLPNKEAALAMSREIALSLRDPSNGGGMPGAMSDSDRNFLSSMTPDISQTAQGRKQIIGAAVAVQQRNQQVAGFARKYEAKYGKLDNGFYDQLSKWSDVNPMFGGAK